MLGGAVAPSTDKIRINCPGRPSIVLAYSAGARRVANLDLDYGSSSAEKGDHSHTGTAPRPKHRVNKSVNLKVALAVLDRVGTQDEGWKAQGSRCRRQRDYRDDRNRTKGETRSMADIGPSAAQPAHTSLSSRLPPR